MAFDDDDDNHVDGEVKSIDSAMLDNVSVDFETSTTHILFSL